MWAHAGFESRAAEDELQLFSWVGLDGVRLVRYDAPGHGLSRPVRSERDVDVAELGRLLVAVAAAAGCRRFVAGGRSMGSTAAVWAATLAPREVCGLLAVMPHTAWEYDKRRTTPPGLEPVAAVVERGGVEAFARHIESVAPPPALAALGARARGPVADAVRAADPASVVRLLRATSGWRLPPRAQVAALTVPALVVAIPDDPAHPLAAAEELVAALPNAELLVVRTIDEVRGLRRRVHDFVVASA